MTSGKHPGLDFAGKGMGVHDSVLGAPLCFPRIKDVVKRGDSEDFLFS